MPLELAVGCTVRLKPPVPEKPVSVSSKGKQLSPHKVKPKGDNYRRTQAKKDFGEGELVVLDIKHNEQIGTTIWLQSLEEEPKTEAQLREERRSGETLPPVYRNKLVLAELFEVVKEKK